MNTPATRTDAKPIVVVGVSGSPASAGALRWAAGEADRLRADFKVVLIWGLERRAFYAPPLSPEDHDRHQEGAVTRLAATVRAVLGQTPRANLTLEVAEGTPEQALVARSAGADLIVLGSASGLTAGRSIGPVIRACLSHAHCPVVVVGPEGAHSDDNERQDRALALVRDNREMQLAVATSTPRAAQAPAPMSGRGPAGGPARRHLVTADRTGDKR